jgi:TonB family protein
MKDKHHSLWIFLFFSLLLHFFILVILPLHIQEDADPEEAAIDLTLLHKTKIADIAPPKKEEEPDQYDFIGMHDSKVAEEQVAVRKNHPGDRLPEGKKEEGAGQKKSPQELYAMRMAEQEKSKQGSEFPPGTLPEDFFPDYKVGPHTYLNMKRFERTSYIVRMMKSFKMTWNPYPAIRSHQYAGEISQGIVKVVLGITLDEQGGLASLGIIQSSGLNQYDQEALRTVRDSAPFAAPPDWMKGPDGKARIGWGFAFHLS